MATTIFVITGLLDFFLFNCIVADMERHEFYNALETLISMGEKVFIYFDGSHIDILPMNKFRGFD